MERSFTRTIGHFQATAELRDGILSLSLKSIEEAVILFANYSMDNMPSTLQNVLNSPEELYQTIQSVEPCDLKVSEGNELVLLMKVFAYKREYPIPLERTNLSKEDQMFHKYEKLSFENQKLKREMQDMKEKYQASEGKNQQIIDQFSNQNEKLRLSNKEVEMKFKTLREQIFKEPEGSTPLQQKLKIVLSQNANLTHQNEQLVVQNKKKSELCSQQECKLSQLELHLQQMEEEHAFISNQFREIEKRRIEQRQEYENRFEQQKKANKTGEECAALQKQIEALQAKLYESAAQNSQLRLHIREFVQNLKQTRRQLMNSFEKFQQQKRQHEITKQNSSMQQRRIKEYENRIQILDQEMQRLNTQLSKNSILRYKK